jgi:hypothetical protein
MEQKGTVKLKRDRSAFTNDWLDADNKPKRMGHNVFLLHRKKNKHKCIHRKKNAL